MCGRYTLSKPGDALDELGLATELVPEELLQPRFNIAPTQTVPVVRTPTEGDGEIEVVPMNWGFTPKPGRGGPRLLINARSETAAEKPSFRRAFQSRRCLVPADGFYEWRKDGKARHAFHFHLEDRAPFCFAGLWQRAPSSDQQGRCLILTTRPHPLVGEVHDRMPVILQRETAARWLSDLPQDELEPLLEPLKSIARTAVGPGVNKVAQDGPELIVPAAHAENLRLF